MSSISVLILAISTLLITPLITAQKPIELSDAETHLWDHTLGRRVAIHADSSKLGLSRFEQFNSHIELEIVVSANGRVDLAHAISGPKQLFDQAESIEYARSFKPFTVDGNIVPVRIHDYVSIDPPEAWSPVQTPFPPQFDLHRVSMSLARTGCFGSCPSYMVTILGNGLVRYEGKMNVHIPGAHTAHISPEAVRSLLNDFRRAEFFSAKDEYRASITDNPTETLTLKLNDLTKTVVDYVGAEVGMPEAVQDLERRVDEVGGTERWVKGNADTLASLKAETWAFRSASPDNMALYISAVSSQNQPLVDEFLKAHTPTDILAPSYPYEAPICAATRVGDIDLVRRMISGQKHLNPAALSPCLSAAVESNNLALVNFWLDKGGRPNAPAYGNPQGAPPAPSVFAIALEWANPGIITRLLDFPINSKEHLGSEAAPPLAWMVERAPANADFSILIPLLVSRGFDVNARDDRGQTPLFHANNTAAIKPLLDAGANINAKDEQGVTPLIQVAFIESSVDALLAAGADPTFVANNGNTALKQAKQYGCEPCYKAIQQAIADRKQTAAP